MNKKDTAQTTASGITRRRFVYSAAVGGLVAGVATQSRRAWGQGKIKLTYVSVGDKNAPWYPYYQILEKQAREATNGDLVIEWTGGPEVIKPFQAPEAVGKGVFDIALSTYSYYANVLPEGIGIQSHIWTLKALHESGAWDHFDEIHRKAFGVSMLGIPQSGTGYIVLLTKPVAKIEDFKGRKVRSIPIYDPLFKALGMATVTLSPSEVYTALERGVVDGAGWLETTLLLNRFHEVAKFMVKPPFYHALGNHIMNEKKLEGLPKDIREALIKASRKTDDLGRVYTEEQKVIELAKVTAEGLKVIELEGEEGKKYSKLAIDAFWEKILQDAPKGGPRVRELMSKAASMA